MFLQGTRTEQGDTKTEPISLSLNNFSRGSCKPGVKMLYYSI